MTKRFLETLAICAGLCVAGCDDDDDSGAETTTSGAGEGVGAENADGGGMDTVAGESSGDVAVPSHAADIQPIWDTYCVDGCHTADGLWPLLPLDDRAYENIVGQPSTQASGFNFIEAGSAADSYLWAKLTNTQTDLGGSGLAMPNNDAELTEQELATIEAWIAGGAPE